MEPTHTLEELWAKHTPPENSEHGGAVAAVLEVSLFFATVRAQLRVKKIEDTYIVAYASDTNGHKSMRVNIRGPSAMYDEIRRVYEPYVGPEGSPAVAEVVMRGQYHIDKDAAHGYDGFFIPEQMTLHPYPEYQ